MNVLLSQIEGEYQERLAACHLTLVTQPPAPGTMIQADSRLLSRVMDNLVSNVCKYALENTRVYVTAAVRDGQAVISSCAEAWLVSSTMFTMSGSPPACATPALSAATMARALR